MWRVAAVGAVTIGALTGVGCGEVTPDRQREDAALVKSAVRLALDAAHAARGGARTGEGWHVVRRRDTDGISRSEALARLRGPRARWPRMAEFAPPAAPDGPGARMVRLSAAPLLGYPGVTVGGWVNIEAATRVADLSLRGGPGGHIAIARLRRQMQVSAMLSGRPVVLEARMRGGVAGRFTQMVVSREHCRLGDPEWADVRATITSATDTSDLLAGVPRAAWARAAQLPLATERRPYVPLGDRVTVSLEGARWMLAVRGPLSDARRARTLPDGTLRGCA